MRTQLLLGRYRVHAGTIESTYDTQATDYNNNNNKNNAIVPFGPQTVPFTDNDL